ncbi:hypothetical protein ABZ759_13030 [Streptomyces sp. NPDC047860]|uniref:hypothetical protein n=1 Tax=Streptomyces sp. NPDC047860 TaxID=3155743 RepID=UPI0033D0ACC4
MNSESEVPTSWYQEVRVEGGFGYGVQHADLHVFANGMPLYLLANWREPPDADPRWLRELPSRMLNARREAVPFTGRAHELDGLRAWRDDGRERAVRWLHGPGGQGKSRLAAQFARETAEAGWRVVHAFHGPDAEVPEPGSEDMSLSGRPGLLLLVDYSDRWRFQHLTWLFKNRLLRAGRTRVLLLARGADAWPAVEGMLDPYEAWTDAVALEPLPVPPAHEAPLPGDPPASGDPPVTSPPYEPRAEMFAAARAAFAAFYERPDVAAAPPPGPLDAEEFGLTLSVHVAALVAVDAAVRGVRPPSDAAGLTLYLLNREQLHWERLHSDGAAAADSGYRTSRAEMNRAVFTAALSGHRPPAEGEKLLRTAGLATPATALRDHTSCYPPPVPGTTLEPLYPDRLAEDFLALTLPGHGTGYPAQEWAPATATRLLTEHTAPLDRGLVFLTTAAERWPHVRHGVLYPLLRAEPHRAVRAGNVVLELLSRMEDIDTALLAAVADEFPLTQHPDLDPGMASLTSVLTARSLPEASGPAQEIWLWQRLATRLLAAGRFAEAEEVSETVRRASEEYAGTLRENRPDLVALLEQHGERLDSGRRGGPSSYRIDGDAPGMREILAAIQGSENHARVRTARAQALLETAQAARSRGRYREGVEIATRAVALLREIDAPASRSALPVALESLALLLGDSGRRAEALDAVEEALGLVRARKDDTDAHRFLLANLLSSRALWLGHLQRYAEAVETHEEALTLCEAVIDRDRYPMDNTLAYLHNNLSTDLTALGRSRESLRHIRAAVAIRKTYAERNETLHGREYAMSLYNLGISLDGVGEYEEALAVTRRSVALLERLAKRDPTALPTLADALVNLHSRTDRVRPTPARTPYLDRAIHLYIELAEEYPDVYLPRLAETAEYAGLALLRNTALVAARRHLRRALPLRAAFLRNGGPAQWPVLARSLALYIHSCAGSAPGWPSPQDARLFTDALDTLLAAKVPPGGREALAELTGMLLASSRYAEGLPIARATVQAVRAGVYDPDALSEALFHFAMLQDATRAPEDETLATLRDALEHLPPEAGSATDPSLRHRRAMILNLASHLHARAGRPEECLRLSDEALATYRPLTGGEDPRFAHHFGFLLENAADLAERCGALDRARAHAEEARAVYLRAAARNPDLFLPALRGMEEFLADKFPAGEHRPEETPAGDLPPESPVADGDR